MHDADLNLYLDRLNRVEDELSNQRLQLARLTVAHHEGRVRAFFSDAPTVKEREFLADYQVLDLSREITEMKAEVRVLEDERDHIRFVLPILMGTSAYAT